MQHENQPFVFRAFLLALATCERKAQVEKLRALFEVHKRKCTLEEIERGEAAMKQQLESIETADVARKADEA